MNNKISVFDVLSKMPQGSVILYNNPLGGRMVGNGKKATAIIETGVSNEDFQDFGFQTTFGEPKEGRKKKFIILCIIEEEEYDRQLALLKKTP